MISCKNKTYADWLSSTIIVFVCVVPFLSNLCCINSNKVVFLRQLATRLNTAIFCFAMERYVTTAHVQLFRILEKLGIGISRFRRRPYKILEFLKGRPWQATLVSLKLFSVPNKNQFSVAMVSL